MTATYASICVPLDGSALAEDAIPFAIAIARRCGADGHVELAHVHEQGVIVANAPMTDGAWEDNRAAAMDATMQALAARLTTETQVQVGAITLRGPVVQSLVQHVADRGIRLIATTTHGRTGFSRAWFGSITESMLHLATVPVLIVRVGEHQRANVSEPLFRHVLLPIDRATSGADALEHALKLGTRDMTRYTLLTVVHPQFTAPLPYSNTPVIEEYDDAERRRADAMTLLAQIAARYRTSGTPVDCRVETHAQPARAILDVAQQTDVDLIVLPTHSRRAASRALLGSVADKVLRGADVPLLVVPVPS
jgi:nucleotide-binding universal stress UspA family protein